jgi:cephalosporin hydroxylase
MSMALKPWQKHLLEPYNFIVERLLKNRVPQTHWKELLEVQARAKKRTDVSSNLRKIFLETVKSKPKVIVELGVKSGESTFAFSRAAMVTDAKLISVDIRDHSDSCDWDKWIFVQMDDLKFAKQFKTWCKKRKIPSTIDVLFIDTAHTYEHTKKEIKAYFPLLSKQAKVFFHDSNLSGWYRRSNFTIDKAWDCKRQVIRAIEEYLGVDFKEKNDFVEYAKGWMIENIAYCNGLLILEKIK